MLEPTHAIESEDSSASPLPVASADPAHTTSLPEQAILTDGLRRTIRLFVGAVATFLVHLAAALLLDAANVRVPVIVLEAGTIVMVASVAVCVIGVPISALHAIGTSALTRDPISPRSFVRFVVTAALGSFGVILGLLGLLGFGRGRQIRVRGKILLPRVGPETGFLVRRLDDAARGTEPGSVDVLPDDEAFRAALASMWRENGRTEHASVAAFARLTLDLMALGAPSRLLIDAQRDALDEIHHAELCFSLARDLDGRPLGPLAFPQARDAGRSPSHRLAALSSLAVDSLIDGAVHEGLSARVVARLAKRCRVPAIRSVLRQIAADEGRHAAHGWDVVEWCVEVGGEPVRAALAGACASLATWTPPSSTPEPRSTDFEPFGIPSRALELEEGLRTRAEVLARVARLVGTEAAARRVA